MPTLKGLVIMATGDFGPSRTAADLKRWIEHNGARYAPTLTAQVTHLVCSKRVWKQQSALVKAAVKKQDQKFDLKVVSYDWLEDSLLAKRKLSEGPYLWSKISKGREETRRQKKQATRRYVASKKPEKRISTFRDQFVHDRINAIVTAGFPMGAAYIFPGTPVQKFIDGCTMAQQDLNSNNYHLYQDDTSFMYCVICTRRDQASIDRVTIKLYESNIARPSQYALVATYDRHPMGHGPPKNEIIVPVGSPFYKAFAAFRKLFQQIVGVEWDFRSWNNALPLNMPGKAALRNEGWRVEALAAESMWRVSEASKKFLNGEHVEVARREPLAFVERSHAEDRCYEYRLPVPARGQLRGHEGLAELASYLYGPARTTEERIGGGPRDKAQPNMY